MLDGSEKCSTGRKFAGAAQEVKPEDDQRAPWEKCIFAINSGHLLEWGIMSTSKEHGFLDSLQRVNSFPDHEHGHRKAWNALVATLRAYGVKGLGDKDLHELYTGPYDLGCEAHEPVSEAGDLSGDALTLRVL